MSSNTDQYLHRLVVAALTVFVIASLLLVAFVAREIWLQQRIVGLSSSLQVNLEELEQTTEEIQSKMSELEGTSEDAPEAQEWDDVNDLLEDVDQQLESIEDSIDEVAVASEAELDVAPMQSEEAETAGAMRTQADQVFTFFAVLTAIAAIVIAVLLGMALRVPNDRLTAH
jgi:hypothetical protein